MSMRGSLVVLMLVLSGLLNAAHVTDRLLVGLYAEPDQQRPPVKLLESGTVLDVGKKRNGFVEVKLSSGQQGWVEAIYVMEEKPAKMRLLEAQASLVTLKRELASLQQLDRPVQRENLKAVTLLKPGADKVALPQVDSQVKRYGPFIAMVLSLVVGIGIGVGVVDYRLKKQLTRI